MRVCVEIIDALWQLTRLTILSRGRMCGRYWHWRMETAFGSDATRMPTRWHRLRATIRFGHWVGRMRRL